MRVVVVVVVDSEKRAWVGEDADVVCIYMYSTDRQTNMLQYMLAIDGVTSSVIKSFARRCLRFHSSRHIRLSIY